MRILAQLGCFVVMAALPSALIAQETGTLIQHKAAQIDDSSTISARIVLRQFVTCQLERHPGRSAKLMGSAVDTAAYKTLFTGMFEVVDDDCLGNGHLNFSRELFRGALFEAAYIKGYKNKSPLAFSADLDTQYMALYAVPYSEPARLAVFLQRFGECVTKADPIAVHKLVLSAPSSGNETQGFAALSPRFGTCILKGEELKFSKPVLRGVLAEAIYRMTKTVEKAVRKSD